MTHLRLQRIVRRRLVLWLLLPCVTLVLVLGALEAVSLQREAERRNLQLAHSLAHQANEYMGMAVSHLETLRGMQESVDAQILLPEAMRSMLRTSPLFKRLVWLNEKHRILFDAPSGFFGLDFPVLFPDLAERRFSFSRPIYSWETRELTIFMALPGMRDHTFVAELNLDYMHNRVGESRLLYPGARIIIMDGYGNLISHPDMNLVREQVNLGMMEVMDALAKENNAILIAEHDGESYLEVGVRVPELGWRLIIATPLSGIHGPIIRTTALYMATLLAVFLGIAMAMRFELNKRIVKPLMDFSATIKKAPEHLSQDDPVMERNDAGFAELEVIRNEFGATLETLRRREQEIRESEQRLKLALEAANDALWDWDVANDTFYMSDQWGVMLGYASDAKPPSIHTIKEFVHPHDGLKTLQALNRSLKKGEDLEVEHRLRTSDGGWKWVLTRGRVVERGPDGAALRMTGTNVDIDERKQTEVVLRTLLGKTADATGQAFFDTVVALLAEWQGCDVALVGRVVDDGERVQVLAMYREGRVMRDFSYPLAGAPCGQALQEGVRIFGDSVQELFPESEVVRDLGTQAYVGAPLINSRGRTIGVVSMLFRRAITFSPWAKQVVDVIAERAAAEIERMDAEVALRQAKEAAEAASSAKSAFLANMSHEIRTPLNGIQGMLQLMQSTDLDEEQNEYAHTALQATRRLTRLLSDILDLSRVEAGMMKIADEPFGLTESIRHVCEMFDVTAKQTGVAFECRTDAFLPARVSGDSARLQQVLSNLIGNAFKFTQEGKVTIEASLLPEGRDGYVNVLCVVSDTGIGIPEDKLEELFEPFTQVEGAFTRRFQGAGLGLSIVKRLVALMGGAIAIDSEPTVGTSVYVTLPFKRLRTLAPSNGDIVQPEKVFSGSCRVLLAEDDAVSRLVVVKHLEKLGCVVDVVENGRLALEALAAGVHDLVLMDVEMPEMDGVTATKAIRDGEAGEQARSIPIVAMTAYAMAGDKEHFLQAGMDGYVSKPVDLDAMQQTMRQVLGG